MNKFQKLIIIGLIPCIFSCNGANSTDKTNNTISKPITDSVDIVETESQYPDIDKKYLLGKINPQNDSLFVVVPQKYCLIRTEYVHKDVLDPFIEMFEAAAKEGVNLGIISSYRSYETQAWLWNSRYANSSNSTEAAKLALKYIAMPGTSRHHWGTDIDMFSTRLNFFETEEGKKAYKWMCENAANYGFYQVYTKNRTTGYNEEKWHWTFNPVSKEFLKQYVEKISYEDFIGFNGCELAKSLNVIDDYVFGIDSVLLTLEP
ncbi:MAG: M15 family metallopeptidase [Bacteroidales bacterium]|nr:M15 family metallopeptidase [Bacteroidales bacterium]